MTAPPTRVTLARQRAAAEKLARQPVATSPAAWHGWFDGSATPNPGAIGIGALLLGPAGERVELSRRAGHGSSGDAEYLALIALLEAAVDMKIGELLVRGDSQVVVHDVLVDGVPGAKGLEDYRARAVALMARIGTVALRWLPRHRNGEADRLSQAALRGAGDGTAGTGTPGTGT